MTFDLKVLPNVRYLAGAITVVLALAVCSGSAFAQDSVAAPAATAPDPNEVLAKVGGEPITQSDMGFAAEDLGQALANVPPASQRAYLLAILIDMKVMAQAARAQDLQDSAEFKRRQTYLEDRSLRRAYFSDVIAKQVTQEKLKQAYDASIADFKPKEEIRARHILVKTEDEIKAIKAAIDKGKPFEVAAMESSIDGSAKNGGDLGYFSRGQMVPAFETAAFALKVGEVSDPVQSQFGWHLIKLEDRRMSAAPSFDQVSQQVQQKLLIAAFDTEIARLKKDVAITFSDPALEAQVKAQSQPAKTGN